MGLMPAGIKYETNGFERAGVSKINEENRHMRYLVAQ